MDGENPLPWERPVRWPAEGLPFDMRALRYVLAAAEQMSFSGAAGALGMKVSSISRNVRDFEDSLGISLFERTSASGRDLHEKAGYRSIAEFVIAFLRICGVDGRLGELDLGHS